MNTEWWDKWKVIISFLVALFTIPIKIGWHFLSTKYSPISRKHSAGIQGFWLGYVTYSDPTFRHGYNLYKIADFNGNLKMHIEHADTLIPNIRFLKGRGIFRPPTMSWFYYYTDRNSHQNGTVTAILKSSDHGSQILQGLYSQIVDSGNQIKILKEHYRLGWY